MDVPITLGKSNADQAHDRLARQAKASRPMTGTGTQVTRSTFGMVFNGNNNPVTRSVKIRLYQITILHNDNYVSAQQLDGDGNLNGTDEYIAKSFTGEVPSTDTIDTYAISYDYTDDNNRTANAVMLGTEVQVCHPRYTVGDIIAVVEIKDGFLVSDGEGGWTPLNDADGNQITLYELSPARFWCAAPDGYTPP